MEFVRLILDASPDRSRLMSTACAANTGVSCSATPGCAGDGGDEGDLDPYASGRGDASRDDVLLDGDSSSSSSVALSTEIVSSRTAPVDVARGGPARDADARVSPGRVPTPPAAGVDAVTPSRRAATPRTPSVSDSSSSLFLGAADDDRVRARKGQCRLYIRRQMRSIVGRRLRETPS